MKILGIDPGLDRTGWAVVTNNSAKQPVLLASGLIHTPAKMPLEKRLAAIYDELTEIILQHSPTEAAIEEVFFSKRADTQANTTHARGVILLACEKQNLKINGYNPKIIKKTVSGNGLAQKPQMQRMVQLMLRLDSVLQPDDTADAAAAALCHLRLGPYNELMKRTQEKMRCLRISAGK